MVGQGPIGLLLMQLARWAGASVFTSDAIDDRLAIEPQARCGGGPRCSRRRARRAARPHRRSRRRLRRCSRPWVRRPSARLSRTVRPGGRVLVFSATSPGETAQVDLGQLALAEKQILTSYSASVDVQELAARLVFEREINVRDLVTHRFPLAQRRRGRASRLAAGAGVLKVVIDTPGRRMTPTCGRSSSTARKTRGSRVSPSARRAQARCCVRNRRRPHLRHRREGVPPRLPRAHDRAAVRLRPRDGGRRRSGRRRRRRLHRRRSGRGRELRTVRRLRLLQGRPREPVRRPAVLERRLRRAQHHPGAHRRDATC